MLKCISGNLFPPLRFIHRNIVSLDGDEHIHMGIQAGFPCLNHLPLPHPVMRQMARKYYQAIWLILIDTHSLLLHYYYLLLFLLLLLLPLLPLPHLLKRSCIQLLPFSKGSHACLQSSISTISKWMRPSLAKRKASIVPLTASCHRSTCPSNHKIGVV